jgi:hypothetical protein
MGDRMVDTAIGVEAINEQLDKRNKTETNEINWQPYILKNPAL